MSGKKPRPPWHAEAIRMRSAEPKPSIPDIAAMLGQKVDAVRYALNEGGERDRCMAKDVRRYAEGRRVLRSADSAKATAYHKGLVVSVHKPRSITRVLADPEVKAQALKDFAAGKIDRDALMRRISV